MPMGRDPDGEWVDVNNNCDNCGHSMPLPNMNRKFCPNCGTFCFVPSEQELAIAEERAKKECPNCGCKNSKDANFCTVCGAKL